MNIPYYIGCAFDDQSDMDFRKEERKKASKKKPQPKKDNTNKDKEEK